MKHLKVKLFLGICLSILVLFAQKSFSRDIVLLSDTNDGMAEFATGDLMKDLIDASGGYNSGCFIKSLDPETGKLWMDAGLERAWIIQKINNDNVQNIADLKRYLEKYSGKKVNITAVRNYSSKTFEIKLP